MASAEAGTRRAAGAVAWDFVRYGSVWEDAEILLEALAPAVRGGRVLSIASAGDNALALLTLDPDEVVAVDLNPAQLACLELRLAAFRRLEHEELLAFLGAAPATDRPGTYRLLRSELTGGARAFWDAHPEEVAAGAMHAGKFERYLRTFRTRVLPLVHPRSTVEEIRLARPLTEQAAFYRERWDTWRWRVLFRLFFSRAVMGRMGRDPAFFAHVEGSVADRILARTEHALTRIPAATNPYLSYVLTGTFPEAALPVYLRAEHHATIRDRAERVRLLRGRVEEAEGRFRAFNLSDIFEYMSPPEHEHCYRALVDRAEPGARLAYWNLLAPRSVPAAQEQRATALPELARALHARDRAWFYGAFHVDEVRAP